MRNDVRLDGWLLHADGPCQDDFLESIFFTGNGRMGVRGYVAGDPSPRPVKQGLFLAGMFDEIKPGITDFIHLPTPVWHQISVKGRQARLCGSVSRTLDMACGLLSIRYDLQHNDGKLHVLEERFFDPEAPSALYQRLTIESAARTEVQVQSGIYCASCNCPVPDDQVKENHETVQLMTEQAPGISGTAITGRWRSRVTGLDLKIHLQLKAPCGAVCSPVQRAGEACGICISGEAAPGRPFTLEKCAFIFTSRDKDPRITGVEPPVSYQTALQQARLHWQKKWAVSDIKIKAEGGSSIQTALRYSIYQLMCSYSGYDDTVSIGARGLTHTRYKGCYFWDTDLFMMPFFLLSAPKAARSLARYRVSCLPQARAHAAKMNSAGARYPWMASYDGTEQCESWDIGASELHVTADVVYALNQYVQMTGDHQLETEAADVYIETARFWKSRYSPDPGTGMVNLLFCKGPDEYCGITSNNLFTNVMVRHNLQLAVAAARRMRREVPRHFEELGLCEAEIAGWEALYKAIKIPRDPRTGRLRADDTFHLLEPVRICDLKNGAEASYHRACFDRLQRYQVIKQADTLLVMSRLPEQFTQEEKQNAWQDFEPKCLHDSTLSFASHALFAAQNGMPQEALNYFQKAAYLDLYEIMGNTGKEGLHLAGAGETWQAVVFGFAGLHFTEDGPALAPCLPEGWEELQFRFFWHGRLFEARVGQAGACSVTPVQQ